MQSAFADILGRVLDSSGQTFFLGQLANGASRTDVALELLSSTEYRTNLVSSYYTSFLGRSGSPSEVAAWVNAVSNGMRDETVIVNFLSSQEYFQGAALGGDTNVSWLTSLYTNPKILNRAPDTSGLDFNLTGMLNGYAAQRQAESTALLSTQEYQTNLVKGWYQKYLGRAADSVGLAGGVQSLAAGFTDEQMIASLVGSAEFFANAGSTNVGFLQAAFSDILGRSIDSGRKPSS